MLKAFYKLRSVGISPWPISFLVFLVFCVVLFPPQILSANTGITENMDSQVEIKLGYGYRNDSLDWNIAGTKEGTDPNILSELKWKDLTIHQLSFGARTLNKNGLFLKGVFDYGWIVNGRNRDSDYNEDNRQDEFSRSNNRSGEGNTLDFSVGLGYPISFGTDLLSFAPVVGYSYHQQDLRLTDGHQTIPDLGSFEGLESTYDAKWQGPWIGVDLRVGLKKISGFLGSTNLCFGYEHHWAAYEAVADWNLRSDFMHPKSFEHEADGQGDKILLGLKSRMSEMTTLGIFYEQQQWTTQKGVDRVFLVTGQVVETQLNEVNWQSQAVRIEISIRF
jgi:hypothetical protein